LNYGFDIVPSLNFSINAGPGKNRNVNVINGVTNTTDNNNLNIGFYSGYWADKWINFWMNFNATYTSSTSSIRPDVTTKYWQYRTYSNFQLKFKKIKLYADLGLETTIYQKTD